MLVNGQRIRGAIVSSYVYTMGFVVSAQRVIKEAFCTALQKLILGSLPPPHLFNKINKLSHKHNVWRQVATGRLLWLVT